MIQATAPGRSYAIIPSSDEFWNAIGVFPTALKADTNLSARARESKKKLRALSRPDLSILCQHFNLPSTVAADADDLATKFLEASDLDSMSCLISFLKRRAVFISREFERRRSARTLTVDVSSSRTGRLKPLTELLILYAHSPDALQNVFYSHLWETKKTNTDFECSKTLPQNFHKKLEKELTDFEKAISKTWGAPVRKFGQHKLPNGLTVLAFDREYAPAIRKDFREGVNVHYRCGDVVFGVSKDRDFIHVKNQNSKITSVVRTLFEQLFEVALTPQQTLTFSDYEPDSLQTALLGGYVAESAIQISSASFRRTALQTGCALSLRARSEHLSIRDDLARLRDDKILLLEALDDLEWLELSFEGKSVKVEVEQLHGGAVRFVLDDANCSAEFVDSLKGQFRDNFGIPLNRMIDPQKMALGAVGVISYLLNVHREREVQNYQRTEYKNLVDLGILAVEAKKGIACASRICSRYKDVVADQNVTVCAACDQQLRSLKYNEVTRSTSQIRSFARDFLKSSGWTMGDVRSFEKNEYFELNCSEQLLDSPVWLLFRDRLSDKDRQQFERSSEAIVIVTARSDRQHIFLDTHGICHVSLAYMIASQSTPESADAAARLCRETLSRLQTSSVLRIEKAAQHSYSHLKDGTKGDKGHVYETEIFNILRALFPYAHQLGREGKAEPDGIVSIPSFGAEGNRDLGQGRTWTWTYDAKHSDKTNGYDLGIDERRKMVNYIGTFRRKRTFMGENSRLRAHAIISNNISTAKMKTTAAFVFGSDGLKKEHRDVRLIFIEEEFLISLYEGFRKHKDEVQRRLPLIGECLIPFLDQDTPERFVRLTSADAAKITSEVINAPEIDRVMPKGTVLVGLDSSG